METGTPGFPLLGEPLAVDLVNTVVAGGAGPRDLLPTPEALDAWRGAQAGRLPPQSSRAPADGRLLTQVQALRAALGALFAAALTGGAPPAEAVAAVNAAADAAPASLRLVWPAAGPPQAAVHHHAPHPSDALLAARRRVRRGGAERGGPAAPQTVPGPGLRAAVRGRQPAPPVVLPRPVRQPRPRRASLPAPPWGAA